MTYRLLIDEQPPDARILGHVRNGETIVITSSYLLNSLYDQTTIGKGPYITLSEQLRQRHEERFQQREAYLSQTTGANPQTWNGLESLLQQADTDNKNVLAIGAGAHSIQEHLQAVLRPTDTIATWRESLLTGDRVLPWQLPRVRNRLTARLMRHATHNLKMHEHYHPHNAFVFAIQPYEASGLRAALHGPASTTQYQR